ncbi:MAG: hypothetical protein Q7T93_04850, partial [Methylobacterium sp.]|nr:hypothetical protein [Methylobacterium sp.]
MPPLIRVLLLLPLAVAMPNPAGAQNFFEELFGIGRAAKPPVPPRGVPGGVQPGTPLAPPPGAPG